MDIPLFTRRYSQRCCDAPPIATSLVDPPVRRASIVVIAYCWEVSQCRHLWNLMTPPPAQRPYSRPAPLYFGCYSPSRFLEKLFHESIRLLHLASLRKSGFRYLSVRSPVTVSSEILWVGAELRSDVVQWCSNAADVAKLASLMKGHRTEFNASSPRILLSFISFYIEFCCFIVVLSASDVCHCILYAHR